MNTLYTKSQAQRALQHNEDRSPTGADSSSSLHIQCSAVLRRMSFSDLLCLEDAIHKALQHGCAKESGARKLDAWLSLYCDVVRIRTKYYGKNVVADPVDENPPDTAAASA